MSYVDQNRANEGVCSAAALLLAVLLACAAGGAWEDEDNRHGRLHVRHPVRHCCLGKECAGAGTRHAFVTSIRSASYMMGLRELACSLNATNPGVPLLIMAVKGDLNTADLAEVATLGELRLVTDIRVPNTRRYTLNWVKLRAWEWTTSTRWSCWTPTRSCAATSRTCSRCQRTLRGPPRTGTAATTGTAAASVFLRPCVSTFHAMLNVVHTHEYYQFQEGYAEQDFLSWCAASSRDSSGPRSHASCSHLTKHAVHATPAKPSPRKLGMSRRHCSSQASMLSQAA